MKKSLVYAAALTASTFASSPSPNILFIFSDDHAIQGIGAYESRLQNFVREHQITPNLDRLADEGAVFTRSYCANSICGPSRASVLTGKHSSQNGHMRNGHDCVFDGSQWTFPKALQKQGYQTALIGKWHLRSDPTGFDHWEILPGQGHYYNPDFIQESGRHHEQGYVTDLITDKTIQWLENRDPEKPFLMMCQHKAPHRTWIPSMDCLDLLNDVNIPEPETLFDNYANRGSGAGNQKMQIDQHMKLKDDLKVTEKSLLTTPTFPSGFARMTENQRAVLDTVYHPENQAFFAANLSGDELTRWKYQRYMRDYFRCIKSVDDSVGHLLEWLDKNGLAENTVVIYSSDQGFYLGEHGWFDKRWIYEESLRMPFLIRWPSVIQPGRVFSEMIQNIDYAPTFLDMAGLEAPAEVQGRSFLPILKGEHPADWRDAVYYHYYEYPVPHQVEPHRGLRTERFTLGEYYRIGEWELFDNQNDPHQLNNVFNHPEYASIAADLKSRLAEMIETFDKPNDLQTTEFTVTGGTLKKNGSILELTGRPIRGYAIRPVPPKIRTARKITLQATLQTAEKGNSNGLLCFGESHDSKNMIKCGVYAGTGEMVVLYGEFGAPEKDIIRKKTNLKRGQSVDVSLTIDLDTQMLRMTVNDDTLTAPLRKPMNSVRFYGINSNRTLTRFENLSIQPQ